MINPEEIPQIDGDVDALVSHAAAITRAGTEFANTGQQVNSTWQGLSAVYQAPESAQLLAATAPVQTVTASVGKDIQAVGTALNTYATEIREIKAQLAALRTQATEFLDSVNGDEDWREDEDKVIQHNGLLDAVGTQLAAYFDAERKCANTINALYCGTQYRPHNGDDKVDAGEHGLTAEQLKTVKELPWGTTEKHDRNFIEDVGAYLASFGETALNALVDMGALIGRDPATGDWSWGTAATAWKGAATFALAITAYSPIFGGIGIVLDQTFGLPGFERGAMGRVLLGAGKSFIAYDQWSEDKARAAGAVTFNIVAIIGTKGAGTALRSTGTAVQGVRGGVVAARVSTTLIRTGQVLERMPTAGDLAGLAAKRFNIRIPIIGPILGIAGDIPQPTHHVDIDMPGPAHPNAGNTAARSSAINDRPYTPNSVEASFDGTSRETDPAETLNIARSDEPIILVGGRPGVSDVDGLDRASDKTGREDWLDSPDFPRAVAIDRGLPVTPAGSRPIEHIAMDGLRGASLSSAGRIAAGGQVGVPRVDSTLSDLPARAAQPFNAQESVLLAQRQSDPRIASTAATESHASGSATVQSPQEDKSSPVRVARDGFVPRLALHGESGLKDVNIKSHATDLLGQRDPVGRDGKPWKNDLVSPVGTETPSHPNSEGRIASALDSAQGQISMHQGIREGSGIGHSLLGERLHAPLSIDEAHARHGETTPAGISHHRGDLNLGDLPHRVPADPRYFTADVHVTPDGRARIGDHTYTPEQYGDLLRRNGWDGKTPIRLIGCDAASNNFADRLSRHTGADVLAPTKPAWTDANGRVYTSDAEIGPDGSRQPKIPPNGEWHTHSPDGTTTRVGDDGYVPATRDADKIDHTTPDGARDRTADKEDTGIPDTLKRQIREERLKKLKYVNETYYLYENKVKLPRYELRIKPSANVIAASRLDMLPPDEVDLKAPDDWSPPKDRVLTEDDLKCVEITLRHDRDAPLAPRYHKGIVLDSRGLSSPERVEGEQALIDERRRAIQEERAAAPESPEYREAHTRTSKHGEELGERGMQHFMSDLYPGATRLDTQLGRQNRYDGVYGLDERRFMARPSEHQRRMIVEAKGPYANKPGVAKALDGKPVKQGHDGYFDRTNHIMQRSDFSEKEIAELRDRLTAEERVPPDQLDRRIAEIKAQEQQMATDLDRLVRYPEEIKARYMQDFLGIDDSHVDAHLHRAESATAGITDHERAAHRLDGGYDRYYDDLINHYKHHGALPADVNAALHRAFAERNESLPDGFVERMMARLEHVRDYGMVEYSRVQAKVREVPLTDYLARYDPDAAGTLDRLPQGQRDAWVREYLAKKGYSAPDLANPGIEVYDGYVAKAYQMRWQRTS